MAVTPEPQTHARKVAEAGRTGYVVVFRDEQSAAAGRAALADATIDVRTGEEERKESLRAEMMAESREVFIVPPSGIHLGEERRPSLLTTPVAVVAGLLLVTPFALGVDASSAAVPIFIWLFGALLGATVGLIFGGVLGRREANKPLAAERGVAVHIDTDHPLSEVEIATLSEHDPIRIDRVLSDGTFEEVVTEIDLHPDLRDRRLGANAVADDDPDVY